MALDGPTLAGQVQETVRIAVHFDAMVLWTKGYDGGYQPYLVPRAITTGTATVCEVCELRH